ncbi:TonB-dependent receptor plug domain-containing protein [Acinetobacter guerrae]|uniref:TonB-dependent receptor plug domain-containing protein n=1 Tax=Acinetobacter guerrae TaxID=1843371 RepID=UPI001F4FDC8B|nr:TonB-dependent receptor [Acinetobacter guerrae]MPW43993.1 TonB-dependent receptor [Acinetobacter guerrae]
MIRRSILTVSVLASMAANANTEVPQQSNENLNIQPEQVKLETIVVTASGTGVDVKDAPASISVITSEDIARRPVSSLADLLGELPGVTGGYSDVGPGSKVAFRGSPDKYTLILVDGKRIGNSSLLGHRPDTISQDLDWISPEMIERIEVVRGSMSTLYGSEAVGGVINIITKKIPDKLSGSLRTDYSQPDGRNRGDTINVAANIAGPITENVGFRLGGNIKKRNADSDILGGTGENQEENISGRLNWRINENQDLNFDLGYGIEKNPAFSEEEELELAVEHFGADKMEHFNVGIGHEGRFENELKTNIDLYYNQYENKTSTFAVDGGSKAQETVLDAKASKPVTLWGHNHEVTAGIQGKYEQVSNASNIGNQFVPDENGNIQDPEKNPDDYSWSVFAEDQIYLRDDFILTLGGRLDGSGDYDVNFSPRIYGVYHPAEAWTVKGGVSRSFRAPNLKERSGSSGTSSMGMGCTSLIPYGWQSGQSCYMLGNPDLDPETSTNYEIGFGYDENGYGVDLTYFLSDYNDLIINDFYGRINGVWYTRQTNVEEARTSGLELTYKFPLNDYLRVNGNATYMLESKNKATGQSLAQTPEFTTNIAMYWDINDRLSTFARVQYLGKQAFTKADIVAGNGTAGKELYFTDSSVTGAVGVNFNYNDNLSVRAGIENIGGDKVNKGNSDYGNAPPATYYVGFTTRF